jgi:hypothetical protein
MGWKAPIRPARLTGELWGLTAYYNPAGYRNKLENLKRYAEGVRRQGLPLLIVELAFQDRPFEVPEDTADRLIRRRTDSVLWQKERLLNIGLRELPAACDRVAWVDADVVFENEDWVAQTAELLRSYVIVQPFDTACWLPPGIEWAPQGSLTPGNQEGQYLPGMAFAMARAADPQEALANYFDHGHTGFAWAGRRDVLERHGFYDCQILGNGDFVMAHAMFGNEDFWRGGNWECARLSQPLLRHIESWGRPFHEDVGGSVTYVPGRVLHLWHGAQRNRLYNQRLLVLNENAFDPLADLMLDADGCWTWKSDKPQLQAWIRDYFHARREE